MAVCSFFGGRGGWGAEIVIEKIGFYMHSRHTYIYFYIDLISFWCKRTKLFSSFLEYI